MCLMRLYSSLSWFVRRHHLSWVFILCFAAGVQHQVRTKKCFEGSLSTNELTNSFENLSSQPKFPVRKLYRIKNFLAPQQGVFFTLMAWSSDPNSSGSASHLHSHLLKNYGSALFDQLLLSLGSRYPLTHILHFGSLLWRGWNVLECYRLGQKESFGDPQHLLITFPS